MTVGWGRDGSLPEAERTDGWRALAPATATQDTAQRLTRTISQPENRHCVTLPDIGPLSPYSLPCLGSRLLSPRYQIGRVLCIEEQLSRGDLLDTEVSTQ
jgi:hypothetical protein